MPVVDMTEELTCVVCTSLMTDAPVLKCEQWHLICGQCFDKLQENDILWKKVKEVWTNNNLELSSEMNLE